MLFAFLCLYCLYEHRSTTYRFLRETFSSVCNKHFPAHVKLFKNFSLPSGPLPLAERWLPGWFAGIWANYRPLTKYCVCSMQLACLWK